MRKNTLILASSALILLTIFLMMNLFIIDFVDVNAYAHLDRQKAQKTRSSSISDIEQKREGVCKDIWSAGAHRLHTRIESAYSFIQLMQRGNKLDFQENLEDIRCSMQHRLFYDAENRPMQEVRTFTAKEGIYSFMGHHFVAEKVNLSFFEAESHILPTDPIPSPFLEGFAKTVSFSLQGNAPRFTAEHLQAKIFPERGRAP